MRKNGKQKDYQKIFNKWNEKREPIKVKVDDQEYIYEPAEGEEFRQCYVANSHKNKGLTFLKARNELPKYWFVSNRGTILTVKNNEITVYLGQFSGRRLQVRCDNQTYSREVIVGLVFADQMLYISPRVRKKIEEEGLQAFKSKRKGQKVEAHHINLYVQSDNILGSLQNLKINACPQNIMFLLEHEHKLLTIYSGSGDELEKIKKASEKPIDCPRLIMQGDEPRSGQVRDITIDKLMRFEEPRSFIIAFLRANILIYWGVNTKFRIPVKINGNIRVYLMEPDQDPASKYFKLTVLDLPEDEKQELLKRYNEFFENTIVIK